MRGALKILCLWQIGALGDPFNDGGALATVPLWVDVLDIMSRTFCGHVAISA